MEPLSIAQPVSRETRLRLPAFFAVATDKPVDMSCYVLNRTRLAFGSFTYGHAMLNSALPLISITWKLGYVNTFLEISSVDYGHMDSSLPLLTLPHTDFDISPCLAV
jgi:hypothetical protein